MASRSSNPTPSRPSILGSLRTSTTAGSDGDGNFTFTNDELVYREIDPHTNVPLSVVFSRRDMEVVNQFFAQLLLPVAEITDCSLYQAVEHILAVVYATNNPPPRPGAPILLNRATIIQRALDRYFLHHNFHVASCRFQTVSSNTQGGLLQLMVFFEREQSYLELVCTLFSHEKHIARIFSQLRLLQNPPPVFGTDNSPDEAAQRRGKVEALANSLRLVIIGYLRAIIKSYHWTSSTLVSRPADRPGAVPHFQTCTMSWDDFGTALANQNLQFLGIEDGVQHPVANLPESLQMLQDAVWVAITVGRYAQYLSFPDYHRVMLLKDDFPEMAKELRALFSNMVRKEQDYALTRPEEDDWLIEGEDSLSDDENEDGDENRVMDTDMGTKLGSPPQL